MTGKKKLARATRRLGDSIQQQLLTVFPTAVVQQTRNVIAVRHYLPRGVDNVVLAGCGTVPGVGVPTALISGRLAADRITGPRRSS